MLWKTLRRAALIVITLIDAMLFGYGVATAQITVPNLTGAPANSAVMLASLTGASGSIGGSLLIAGGCTSTVVSMPGATTSMVAVASPATYPGDGVVWDAYVSSSGNVTIKVCGILAITPVSSTYNVRVIQ